MKRILAGLAIALAAIVAAALAAPLLVPTGMLKDRVAAFVRDRTGRELRIAGPISVALVPRVTLAVAGVTLSNMPGGVASTLLEAKTLDVSIRLLPLLTGSVEVERIALSEPRLNLEIDQRGQRNWVFLRTSTSAVPPSPASGRNQLFSYTVERLAIAGGAVSYLDQRTGDTRTATDIALTASLSGEGAVDAAGSAKWNGEAVRFLTSVASLDGLRNGSGSPAAISLDAAPVAVRYHGQVSRGKPIAGIGEIDLKTPSLRGLLAWAGVHWNPPGTGLGPLSLNGKIAIGTSTYAVAGATLALDGMSASGDLSLERGGGRPLLTGSLSADRLDLDAYLAPPAQAAVAAAPAPALAGPAVPPAAPARPTSAPALSDTPIDLAPLRFLNADLRINAGAIRLDGFESGKSVLAARLTDGNLRLDIDEMALYRGAATGIVAVDASEPEPSVAATLSFTGVAVQPLLVAASGIGVLSGTGDLVLDLKGRGDNLRALVASLSGNGGIDIADGQISGIAVDLLTSAPNSPGGTGNQTLAYSTLSATYTISHGILTNGDLKLTSPELTSTGQGLVNLSPCRADYRWYPVMAGKGRAQIAITGPCDDLSYRAMSVTITPGTSARPKK